MGFGRKVCPLLTAISCRVLLDLEGYQSLIRGKKGKHNFGNLPNLCTFLCTFFLLCVQANYENTWVWWMEERAADAKFFTFLMKNLHFYPKIFVNRQISPTLLVYRQISPTFFLIAQKICLSPDGFVYRQFGRNWRWNRPSGSPAGGCNKLSHSSAYFCYLRAASLDTFRFASKLSHGRNQYSIDLK